MCAHEGFERGKIIGRGSLSMRPQRVQQLAILRGRWRTADRDQRFGENPGPVNFSPQRTGRRRGFAGGTAPWEKK